MKMRKNRIIQNTMALMGLVGLLGCAAEKNPAAPEPTASLPPVETEIPDHAAVMETPRTPLDGKWQSTCVEAKVFGIAESTKLEASDGTLVSTIRTSREADCSLPDIEVIQIAKLNVETDADQNKTGALKLEDISIRIKPLSPVGLSTLQIRKWCKQEAWALGKETDVTTNAFRGDKNCSEFLRRRQFFKIDGDKLNLIDDQRDLKNLSEHKLFFVRTASEE
jgi:hypothetical protein